MKITGAAIIMICSFACGIYLSDACKKSLYTAETVYNIMKRVRDEICLNKTPTEIIINKLDFGMDLSAAKYKGLYSAALPYLSSLNNDEKNAFKEFCENIGKGSAELQQGGFDIQLEKFGSYLEKRRKEFEKNKKLYASMSAFAGIIAVIILF